MTSHGLRKLNLTKFLYWGPFWIWQQRFKILRHSSYIRSALVAAQTKFNEQLNTNQSSVRSALSNSALNKTEFSAVCHFTGSHSRKPSAAWRRVIWSAATDVSKDTYAHGPTTGASWLLPRTRRLSNAVSVATWSHDDTRRIAKSYKRGNGHRDRNGHSACTDIVARVFGSWLECNSMRCSVCQSHRLCCWPQYCGQNFVLPSVTSCHCVLDNLLLPAGSGQMLTAARHTLHQKLNISVWLCLCCSVKTLTPKCSSRYCGIHLCCVCQYLARSVLVQPRRPTFPRRLSVLLDGLWQLSTAKVVILTGWVFFKWASNWELCAGSDRCSEHSVSVCLSHWWFVRLGLACLWQSDVVG
jgi:hypothetical protein